LDEDGGRNEEAPAPWAEVSRLDVHVHSGGL